MGAFREYVLSVIAATVICAVIGSLLHDTKEKELFRLLGGLVLMLTIIKPISNVDLSSVLQWEHTFSQTAHSYKIQGEKEADEALAERIKAELEAYILAEADRLNTQLMVEVDIDDSFLPQKIYLSGSVSPYARQQLESFLETTFSVTKENQVWTG